jgi:hypothetical protein
MGTQSLRADLIVVHGAAHGGSAFYDEERLTAVKRFLSDASH